ncbi:glycosyltransferase family 4 protein [Bacteroides sp. GD17]|jgi:glycosyltransferase involved in cell wall biosynthesis|uniref:glycosyltransferase family 4 protein n=1 Tax=Bacteroides sp. GD17 TaxID=3139826 RepID=UPI0025DB0A93|nr:glycosyltransferase family 4 protein [uncultured Bacteroides sp.]
MKVLYCNPIFAAYRIPFYMELNRLLDNNFYVLYSERRYENDIRFQKLKNDIPVKMGQHAIPFINEKFYYTKLICLSLTRGLIRTIAQINPDALITEGFGQWTPFVITYATQKKIPVYIGYERTLHTEKNNPWVKTLHRKLTDHFVTGYLVNGAECKKYLQSIGIKENKIFIGGMNADSQGLKENIAHTSEAAKQYLRQKLNLNSKGLSFLFTGMLIERKGLIYLLKVWNEHLTKHPHDHLVIVGTGDKMEEYQKEFTHPSIHFVGRIEYDQIGIYYDIADVYIIPTLEDNWSLVVPEAMACGLPIACSQYNGCHPELIDQDNGYVFNPLDPHSIRLCLDYFHHQDLAKMGAHSVEKEAPFNAENSARRVYDVIIKTCKK